MTRPGEIAPFVGWKEPATPQNIREARDWVQRLNCLAEYHPEKWAAFGPYTTKKAAQNTGSNAELRRKHYLPHWKLERHVSLDDKTGGWLLHLRLIQEEPF